MSRWEHHSVSTEVREWYDPYLDVIKPYLYTAKQLWELHGGPILLGIVTLVTLRLLYSYSVRRSIEKRLKRQQDKERYRGPSADYKKRVNKAINARNTAPFGGQESASQETFKDSEPDSALPTPLTLRRDSLDAWSTIQKNYLKILSGDDDSRSCSCDGVTCSEIAANMVLGLNQSGKKYCPLADAAYSCRPLDSEAILKPQDSMTHNTFEIALDEVLGKRLVRPRVGATRPMAPTKKGSPFVDYLCGHAICHDLANNYRRDRREGISTGCSNDYVLWHWESVGIFMYFSHHIVCPPPLSWIRACHANGTRCYGTVMFEFDKDRRWFLSVLKDVAEHLGETSLQGIAEQGKFTGGDRRYSPIAFIDGLVCMAKDREFEGWLLNFECAVTPAEAVYIPHFVRLLREGMKKAGLDAITSTKDKAEVPIPSVIWYDSIGINGLVRYANRACGANQPMARESSCLFINYAWSNQDLLVSQQRCHDDGVLCLVGVDVWGRQSGSGGIQGTVQRMQRVAPLRMPIALFAPGWTYEQTPRKRLQNAKHFTSSLPTFHSKEERIWAATAPYRPQRTLLMTGESSMWDTNFCAGYGLAYHVNGSLILSDVYFDMNDVALQPDWRKGYVIAIGSQSLDQLKMDVELCHDPTHAFDGGVGLALVLKAQPDAKARNALVKRKELLDMVLGEDGQIVCPLLSTRIVLDSRFDLLLRVAVKTQPEDQLVPFLVLCIKDRRPPYVMLRCEHHKNGDDSTGVPKSATTTAHIDTVYPEVTNSGESRHRWVNMGETEPTSGYEVFSFKLTPELQCGGRGPANANLRLEEIRFGCARIGMVAADPGYNEDSATHLPLPIAWLGRVSMAYLGPTAELIARISVRDLRLRLGKRLLAITWRFWDEGKDEVLIDAERFVSSCDVYVADRFVGRTYRSGILLDPSKINISSTQCSVRIHIRYLNGHESVAAEEHVKSE
eukprot:Clim_evm73s25 gene=Clim_evmTU73s25